MSILVCIVPWQPPPAIFKIAGTATSLGDIYGLVYCPLDRSLYYTSPLDWNFRRVSTSPPYMITEYKTGTLSAKSLAIDKDCNIYAGTDTGGNQVVKVITPDGAMTTVGTLPATAYALAIDFARSNIIDMLTGTYTEASPRPLSPPATAGRPAPVFSLQLAIGPTGDPVALAVDTTRDRLWWMTSQKSIHYLDLKTDTANPNSVCTDGLNWELRDGPCATARIYGPGNMQYIEDLDAIIFPEQLGAMRVLKLKEMEIMTIAGGNQDTAVTTNADGVGTAARIAHARAAAWDSVTGDLYLGVGYGAGWIFRITTGASFLKAPTYSRFVINSGSVSIASGAIVLE
eukprot:tig00021179_g19264.t1